MSHILRHKYLDPAVLENMGSMQVRARQLVNGILAGLHRSPHKGGAVEFAEYTEYSPGHEIRHIDWRVYAKTDRYYVKQYEDETNLRAYLIIDGSGSMNFQSELAALSKLRYCSFLAATFAYLLVRQGDAVGALHFDETMRQFLPASSRKNHLDDVFRLLDTIDGNGKTSLLSALQTVAERAPNRSRIMIFSDYLSVEREVFEFLRVLGQKQFDISLFHSIDPAEITFPYEGLTIFDGLEDEGELLVDPDDLRHQYMMRIRQHIQWVELQARESNVDYFGFQTNEPLEKICLDFLRRQR